MPIRGIFERPPSSGVWWISYCDGEGKRHREKAGRRSAALDALGRRRLEVKEGRYIPPRAGARLTFRELAKAAMARKKLRLAPTSYETDNERLQQLLPLIGNLPADRLTPARIEETLAHFKRRVSGSTVNRFHALISSIYKFAVLAGRIGVNPMSKVKRYKENESRLRWLNGDEEKQIRDALVADSHEMELDLAINTGMRRGEQFWLEWQNVVFGTTPDGTEQADLTVHGKTGRRQVKANSAACAALRKLQAITGTKTHVSPDAREGLKRDSRRWLEDAAKKAGVKNFRWHDLRHTFASRLVMNGVDIRTVQELLGHKSITMTMKYAHLAPDSRQSAVERVNKKEETRSEEKKEGQVREPGEEKEGGQEEASAERAGGRGTRRVSHPGRRGH
jgi:site-specific recombinase XerD